MKNTIKIATIITMIIMILCGIATATAETADRGEFYPKMTVVTAWERLGETDLYIITVTDKDGAEWSFYGGQEDAKIGAIFSLLMWNLGEQEENDEIIEVYREGTMDAGALKAWLTGEWQ